MWPDCLLGVVPLPTDSRLSETNLDGALCTVAIADEHRPTAGAAFAFEPDADWEVEEVVVVEERDLESRWSMETSTGAVQAAVQLS